MKAHKLHVEDRAKLRSWFNEIVVSAAEAGEAMRKMAETMKGMRKR